MHCDLLCSVKEMRKGLTVNTPIIHKFEIVPYMILLYMNNKSTVAHSFG